MKPPFKYGEYWPTGEPLAIELGALRRNGSWINAAGKQCGEGLVHHVKEFQRIVWPDKQWHRWNEKLIIPEFCNGGEVSIFGGASSGKTREACDFMLTMYWTFPQMFTGLVSTTTRELLDMRIWGEIKKRFKIGKARYPWLAGHLIDSKQQITTDGKEVEGREFRNGIKGVPCKKGGEWQGLGDYCFPAGELVDTSDGPRPIESISPGDVVYSAIGKRRVVHTGSRIADKLVRVTLLDGRQIDCTPEHPFLTQWGWQTAIDLNSDSIVFSPHETMSLVRKGLRYQQFKKGVLLQEVQGQWKGQGNFMHGLRRPNFGRSREHEVLLSVPCYAPNQRMPVVQKVFRSRRQEERFLHEVLREQMEDVPPLVCETNPRQDRSGRQRTKNERMDDEKLGLPRQALCAVKGSNQGRTCHCSKKELDKEKIEWRKSIQHHSRRSANAARTNLDVLISRGPIRTNSSVGSSRGWISALLQTGSWLVGHKIGRGSGWRKPYTAPSNLKRQTQGTDIKGTRVHSVKVLERPGDGRYDNGQRGYRVYNLQVEGHPSFSVNGVVVHNSGIKNKFVMLIADELHVMQEGFLQGPANLKSNPRFMGIYLGNLTDLNTPLGTSTEPEKGWDAIIDSDVSRVYKTRALNGRAIQLIGKDSPNMDWPAGAEPFPDLIGRRFIAECAADYGEGTLLYNAMAAGRIPRGTMEQRVITKQLCLQHNAFEPVVWSHEPLTKLYCADISYTGEHGDRTCGMPMAFGKDSEGKMRLALMERPLIYTPSDRGHGSIEEQIAIKMQSECERLDIPPAHVFFDGTGRSSFTSAIMRLWSTAVNAVEFGGAASERPNFLGRKYREGKDEGELLPCKEIFGKFVTELWFAVRYVIEFDQFRGLTEEVAKEGYLRVWTTGKNNKMDVEPKKEMKLRLGRSPDVFDAAVSGVEGARRLGFVIGKANPPTRRKNLWFGRLKEDMRESWRKDELVYN